MKLGTFIVIKLLHTCVNNSTCPGNGIFINNMGRGYYYDEHTFRMAMLGRRVRETFIF